MMSDCQGSSINISSSDSSTPDLQQRNTNRKVTFSLNPDLTIQELSNECEEVDVFEDCVVITNKESVNEIKTD